MRVNRFQAQGVRADEKWIRPGLLAKQSFRVGLINGLIELANVASLSLNVAANAIGEYERSHVKLTHLHEFLFRLITQIHLGEGNRDAS